VKPKERNSDVKGKSNLKTTETRKERIADLILRLGFRKTVERPCQWD